MTEFDPQAFVATLPNKPGVYRMLGKDAELLYVGKAKNLKNRVSSYFRSKGLNNKTVALVSRINNIEVTITHSETEALLLEQTLIKEHRPPYNIMLVDDKGYPFILLTKGKFPGVYFHRGAKKKKGEYFGPFPSAGAVRETLAILQKTFKVRQCEDTVFENRSRPCLQYQIKRCKAPCVNYITEENYDVDVNSTAMFLKGKSSALIQTLELKMDQAAEQLEFEQAAEMRDQIANVRKIQEQQSVTGGQGNIDVFAASLQGKGACIAMLVIRDGRVLGSKSFFPKVGLEDSEADMLENFLGQFYFSQRNHEVPSEVILSQELPNHELFETVFEKEFARKVRLASSVRGERAKWLKLTQTNAEEQLALHIANRQSVANRFKALQKVINWDGDIERMECFDISHSLGEATVASCVVFDQQGPKKSDYRKFNIEGVTPGDDYGAMEQALTRRYTRLLKENRKLPDLLIVDGGKGQMNIAIKVMQELQLTGTVLMGISKGEGRKPGLETLYLGDTDTTLNLEKNSSAFHLLQHIRDEAHRFAITGHRGIRAKARTGSKLDEIPGVGPERRKSLIRHFGSARGVEAASVDEIAKVKGVSKTLAENIYEHLHN